MSKLTVPTFGASGSCAPVSNEVLELKYYVAKTISDAPGVNVKPDPDAPDVKPAPVKLEMLKTIKKEEPESPKPGEMASTSTTTATHRPSRAFRRYKSALRIMNTLAAKLNWSPADQKQFSWAQRMIVKWRKHVAARQRYAAHNNAFCNKIADNFHQEISKNVNVMSRKARKRNNAALRIIQTLGGKTNRSAVEQKQYSRAMATIEQNRKAQARSTIGKSVLPERAEKRKFESNEGETSEDTKKPKISHNFTKPSAEVKPIRLHMPVLPSVVEKEGCLAVALIDRSHPNGGISLQQWKIVEMRLLEQMVIYMDDNPDQAMPSFNAAGWLNGVKILKCNDETTLDWCRQTIQSLHSLWAGAKLEIVDMANIPSVAKAKVLIPIVVAHEAALRLMQRQNPDIPTKDWKVLKVYDANTPDGGGQQYVLQINKEAEDMLYPRFGKMAWGVGSVYLRLKKRNENDIATNKLKVGEVESDLGLEISNEEPRNLTLVKTE